jgi:hypothetical protein
MVKCLIARLGTARAFQNEARDFNTKVSVTITGNFGKWLGRDGSGFHRSVA